MKVSVLLIEDDEQARAELGSVIRKNFECSFFEASDGKEGLDIAINENIDIVVSDIRLPKMSGTEILTELRNRSKDTMFIFLTAYTHIDDITHGIIKGALDFIPKPIDLDDLLFALERAKDMVRQNRNHETVTTVLIAEDEVLARTNLADIIRDEGYTVYEAENGEAAVKEFYKHKIDIALLDIKMPKMSGAEALKEMRKYSTDFEALILTGYSDDESAIQVLRSGAFYFVKKPVDLDSLLLLIEKAEEKLKLNRALRYRNRENQLMTLVLNKLTKNKDYEICLAAEKKELFQQAIDIIPISMLIVNADYTILHKNNQFKLMFQGVNELDEALIKRLNQLDQNVTIDDIKKDIDKVLKSSAGDLRVNQKYSSVMFTHIQLLDGIKTKDCVLVLLRIPLEKVDVDY